MLICRQVIVASFVQPGNGFYLCSLQDTQHMVSSQIGWCEDSSNGDLPHPLPNLSVWNGVPPNTEVIFGLFMTMWEKILARAIETKKENWNNHAFSGVI